jgi:hypothetical protein
MAMLIAGAPPEKVAVMAQRKKRAAARRGKAATRGKARKPAKSVRGKTAKRISARATPRKRVTKAKSKRADRSHLLEVDKVLAKVGVKIKNR